MSLSIDWETVAKGAVDVAASAAAAMNPVAGIVMAWAGKVVFEIVDEAKKGSDAVAVAQLAGDRVADLVEDLKLGSQG